MGRRQGGGGGSGGDGGSKLRQSFDQEASISADAIYGEKFDSMNSMLRENLRRKSKKLGESRDPNEASELEIVDNKGSKKDKIVKVYSDFMTRVTQFEEHMSMGSRLLVGFQQALGRPPVDKMPSLVERIIKANSSRRVLSYVEAGWVNSHDSVQNVSKSKTVVNELECLLDDAVSIVQTANGKDEDVHYSLNSPITSSDEEEVLTSGTSKPEVTDYAAMMAIIYSMVKQDYTMQVRIVSSLNHKSSSGELDNYCQMWSLRPFVDDDVMHKAWKLVS